MISPRFCHATVPWKTTVTQTRASGENRVSTKLGVFHGVSVAAVQELADELGHGGWQVQGDGAQGQLGPVRGEGDLVPGEAGDAGWRLSVEQYEQAGYPVLGGVAVVV